MTVEVAGGSALADLTSGSAYDSGQQNAGQVKRDMQAGKQRAEQTSDRHQDRIENGANAGSRSSGSADRA